MASKTVWENLYRQGEQHNIAPYTEIFSFLARNFGTDARGKKLLEIGCGVGNNLVFAKWALGFEVYGVDQSETAIDLARQRFGKNNLPFEHLATGDVTTLDFANEFFEVVIDRAAIQHNTYQEAKAIISQVYRVLKPGGLFYTSMTSDSHPMVSEENHLGHGDYLRKGLGVCHAFSKDDILALFSAFEIQRWYHLIRQDVRENTTLFTTYHLELMKKPNRNAAL